MTKAELVEEVSRVSDLTKKHSELIVDTVFTSIIEALQRGEKIELRVPYFKPGKELKELINKESDVPAPPEGSAPAGAANGAGV